MSRLPLPLRILFVVCAGIGTFYFTSQWAMGSRSPHKNLDELVVQPVARPRASTPIAATSAAAMDAAAEAPPLGRAERAKAIPGSKGNPFAHLSWLPPPPSPAPAPVRAPTQAPVAMAPVAPPMPFTFVGMLERDAAKPSAFLAKGEALLIVSAGDVLDNGAYRIDSLSDTEIVMTFLPLNTQQSLTVSGRTK